MHIFFLAALFSLGTHAKPNHLPHEVDVPNFPGLVIAPSADFHTKVLYSRKGLIPGKSIRGLVLLYPGTSAATHSEFGLGNSMGRLVQMLTDGGYAAIAFQPPIYWLAEDATARIPYVERYTDLNNDLLWLKQTAEFANQALKDELGTDQIDAFYYGRSTFAAVGLEAYHRWYQAEPGSEFVAKFRRMLLPGLLGHKRENIASWGEAERVFYKVLHPDKADIPVVDSALKLFPQMGWQTASHALQKPQGEGPTLDFTLGILDEFCENRPSTNLQPIFDFVNAHPSASVELLVHNGLHNPAQPVPGETSEAAAKRLRLILDSFLSPTRAPKGFQSFYVPDRSSVLVASPKNLPHSRSRRHLLDGSHIEFDRCHNLLSRAGLVH